MFGVGGYNYEFNMEGVGNYGYNVGIGVVGNYSYVIIVNGDGVNELWLCNVVLFVMICVY